MMTVLPFTAGLTDRQAAEAVRARIDWKYCLGLALDDPGFDFSVLSEFRARLVQHGLAELVLDVLLERLVGLGLVKAGGKQRTDSTHALSTVRDLNRTELAGESVRACLEALAVAAPDWLAA
jgi:transposase